MGLLTLLVPFITGFISVPIRLERPPSEYARLVGQLWSLLE